MHSEKTNLTCLIQSDHKVRQSHILFTVLKSSADPEHELKAGNIARAIHNEGGKDG